MTVDPFEYEKSERDCDLYFRVIVDGNVAAEIWGPSHKRDWVFNKLSQHLSAFAEQGTATVQRKTNGEWRQTDDWNKLTH